MHFVCRYTYTYIYLIFFFFIFEDKGFFRTFTSAYLVKTSVALATRAVAGKVFIRGHWQSNLQKIYLSNDHIRFSLFVSLMSFFYKGLVCGLRRWVTKKRNVKWVYGFAGFVSGSFILMDDRSRRRTMGLYLVWIVSLSLSFYF